MLLKAIQPAQEENIIKHLAEMEACFIAIVDINLPDLEEQIGKNDPIIRDIRETCRGGLIVVEKLLLGLL